MNEVTVERRPAAGGRPALELRRSRRRKRTATAYPADGRIVVQLPAGLAPEEEQRMVSSLVDRVTGRDNARRAGGDEALARRAAQLADLYLDGVRPSSIRWSSRMQRRYASCTPVDGSIRVSDRLAAYPGYVLDAVLIHELAHLVEPSHSRRFRALLERHPEHERARGFLEGIEFAESQRALDEDRDLA